jgi:hypothetical protein
MIQKEKERCEDLIAEKDEEIVKIQSEFKKKQEIIIQLENDLVEALK